MAHDDRRTRLLGELGGAGQESGLADPGVAAHEDERGLSLGGAADRVGEELELG